ncbi:MAG: hypothetical protein Tsb002_00970 [Wenzhouxiangellaceae bacterium]
MQQVKKPTFPAKSVSTYQYWAQIVKVVDGDTVDLVIDVGFNTTVSNRFRLVGIDTPEMFGVRHDSDEYQRGIKAKSQFEGLLPPSGWVEVRVFKSANREKYGRYLCELFSDSQSINKKMKELGYGNE